jgi:hypothetical protein
MEQSHILKNRILPCAVAFLLVTLSGCVVVHDRKPDAVTTTRETTVSKPAATTTVERTTVY